MHDIRRCLQRRYARRARFVQRSKVNQTGSREKKEWQMLCGLKVYFAPCCLLPCYWQAKPLIDVSLVHCFVPAPCGTALGRPEFAA